MGRVKCYHGNKQVLMVMDTRKIHKYTKTDNYVEILTVRHFRLDIEIMQKRVKRTNKGQ